MREAQRVCIVGLDGATFDLIKPWAKEGKLPYFKKFIEEGCIGDLRSTIPAQTPPAWTSSVTGQNPGKHNIYNFFKVDGNDYRRKLTNHGDRRSKALWNILSEEGKTVAVVSVPFTYPPEKVNGVMVSGIPLHSGATDHTYPDSLISEIMENVPAYRLWGDFDRRSEEALLRQIYERTAIEMDLVRYLLKKTPWDFFMTVFVGLDAAQHLFWRYMDRGHPHFDPKRSPFLGDGILACYQMMDRFLGDVVEVLGDEATLVVYSDHGFGPLHNDFYITNWLMEEGFLVLKERPEGLRNAFFLHPWMKHLGLFLDRSGERGLKRVIPPKILKKFMRQVFPSYHGMLPLIDWSKTRAYFPMVGDQSIHINLEGRDPMGIVAPGLPYEELKQTLIEKLAPWVESGVIEKIYRREEIYDGEYLKNAPDLVIEMKDEYRVQEGIGPSLLSSAKDGVMLVSGSHRKKGIFMIRGKGIKKGSEVHSPHIMDMAPTVLYLLGIPIPKAMDGKALLDIFEEEHRQKHKIRFDEREMRREGTAFDYETDEKAEIMKKLETLGYVG